LPVLQIILRQLPGDFPAALLIVTHLAPDGPGLLPAILQGAGPLDVLPAADDTLIAAGHVYVAPPDHHLLVDGLNMRLSRGPRENRFRPAIDPLFRTAAAAFGPRVIGVLLSGGLDDGVLGLCRIKARGGIAVVQEPYDAHKGDLPQRAIDRVDVDFVLPANSIAETLTQLVHSPAGGGTVTDPNDARTESPDAATRSLQSGGPGGTPSPYSCPECGGALWELQEGTLTRFQCHVGHRLSEGSLLSAHADAVEAALWTALRALEEQASLHQRLVVRAQSRGAQALAEISEQQARDIEARADVIRQVLLGPGMERSKAELEGQTSADNSPHA